MADKIIRLTDKEAAVILEKLRKIDHRTIGGMVAYLIHGEAERRRSASPPQVIPTLEERG